MTVNVKLRLRRLNDDYKMSNGVWFRRKWAGDMNFEGKSC